MSNEYNGKAERSEFRKWFWTVIILCALAVPIFWGLGAAGIIGKTALQREVFEQSYQRQAGQAQQIAIFEAQLAEINRKLSSTSIDENTRTDLEAQASAIRVQVAAAKNQ